MSNVALKSNQSERSEVTCHTYHRYYRHEHTNVFATRFTFCMETKHILVFPHTAAWTDD